MELEAVGRVPVCDLGFEIRRQIDDADGAERAPLRADTTSYAQSFGDVGNLRLRSHFDAELAGFDDWARLFALLSAFLFLA
jgi:hypothetical protein